MDSNADRWERFLDPEHVRRSLFLATMFITTFEILKDSIVDRIRDFYIHGLDETGPVVSTDYQSLVLCRNKSPVYASLDWLREHEAIDEADLKNFEELKDTRNLLAHKLFNAVTGQIESAHSQQFPVLFALLQKIETWWVVNVEIPTHTDYDGQNIDQAEIVPSAVLSLQILFEVASGNTALLKQWREMRQSDRPEA